MIIVGDIGNTEIKIFLSFKNQYKKILLDTKNINYSVLRKKLNFLKKHKYEKNILFCSVVPKVYNKLNKFFFNDYKFPEGRGDIKLINLKGKKINLIDESYNSNPLSLKFALNKLNNLNANSKRKLILLGDMLELGKHSKKFHRKAAEFINHTEIDKVYVYGKDVIETFNKIRTQKRGKI